MCLALDFCPKAAGALLVALRPSIWLVPLLTCVSIVSVQLVLYFDSFCPTKLAMLVVLFNLAAVIIKFLLLPDLIPFLAYLEYVWRAYWLNHLAHFRDHQVSSRLIACFANAVELIRVADIFLLGRVQFQCLLSTVSTNTGVTIMTRCAKR